MTCEKFFSFITCRATFQTLKELLDASSLSHVASSALVAEVAAVRVRDFLEFASVFQYEI